MNTSAIPLNPHAHKTDNQDFKYTTLTHASKVKNHLLPDSQS